MVRVVKESQNPRTPGTTPAEMRRLVVLFLCGGAMALVVLGVFDDPTASDSGADQLPPLREETLEFQADREISPWRPDRERLNGLISDSGPRGRLAPDTGEAINLLAIPLSQRSHLDFKSDPAFAEVGGYELVPPKELADPARSDELRGRPVEVVGTLVSQEFADPRRYELDREIFGDRPLVSGVLRTDDGVEVNFIEIRRDASIEPLIVTLRYKVMGVFYRLVEVGDTGVIRPFVLAKKMVRPLPRVLSAEHAPDVLPDDLAGRLRAIEDETLDRAPHLDAEFMELVGYLLKKGPAAIPEDAEVVTLSGRDPLNHPDEFRLRPVRMEGLLVYAWKETLEYEDMRPEDAPLLGYWHVIVSDPDPEVNVPISVIIPSDSVPEELAEWEAVYRALKSRPWLDVTGIYYRLHAYEARGGKQRDREVHLPVIIAVGMPEITVSTPAEATDVTAFLLVFSLVGVGLVGGLVWMLSRDRRHSRHLDARMRESRVRRRRTQGMDLNIPKGSTPTGDEPGAP